MRHRFSFAWFLVLVLAIGCEGSGQTGSFATAPPCSCVVLGGSVAVTGTVVSVDDETLSLRVDRVLADNSGMPATFGVRDVIGGRRRTEFECQNTYAPAVGDTVVAAYQRASAASAACPDAATCAPTDAGLLNGSVFVVPLTDPVDFGPGDQVPLNDVGKRGSNPACP